MLAQSRSVLCSTQQSSLAVHLSSVCSPCCLWIASHILVWGEFEEDICSGGSPSSIRRDPPVNCPPASIADVVTPRYDGQQHLGLLHVEGGAQAGVRAHAKGRQGLRSKRRSHEALQHA